LAYRCPATVNDLALRKVRRAWVRWALRDYLRDTDCRIEDAKGRVDMSERALMLLNLSLKRDDQSGDFGALRNQSGDDMRFGHAADV